MKFSLMMKAFLANDLHDRHPQREMAEVPRAWYGAGFLRGVQSAGRISALLRTFTNRKVSQPGGIQRSNRTQGDLNTARSIFALLRRTLKECGCVNIARPPQHTRISSQT